METSLRGRPAGVTVWLLRAATVAMLFVGVTVARRKFSHTGEQEELTRYVELQVPAYLDDLADVHARWERLSGPPPLSPAGARSLLVDEAIPRLLQARKRAAAVAPSAASVRASNDEYLAALDRLIDACRTAVRAIDDPSLNPAAGHKMVRERRRDADDAIRAWLARLRERCTQAGLELPGRSVGE